MSDPRVPGFLARLGLGPPTAAAPADVTGTRRRPEPSVARLLAQPGLEDILAASSAPAPERLPGLLGLPAQPTDAPLRPMREPAPVEPGGGSLGVPLPPELQAQRYRDPGSLMAGLESGLNAASFGLGRPVGSVMSDALRSVGGLQDYGTLRENRARANLITEAKHPTARRYGEWAGIAGGAGLEYMAMQGLLKPAAQAVARSAERVLADEAGKIGVGGTKFLKATDEEVAKRYTELVERTQKNWTAVHAKHKPWSSYDEHWDRQFSGDGLLGAAFDKGRAHQSERLVNEAREELFKRGFTEEQIAQLDNQVLGGFVDDASATLPLDRPIGGEAVPPGLQGDVPVGEPPIGGGGGGRGPRPPKPPRGGKFTPPGPEDDFVNVPKFNLSDEAGEQRLRETVRQAVQDKGLDPKRVVTWEETRALAKSLGVDDLLPAEGVASPLTGAEALAIRNIVKSNIEELGEISTRLATTSGDEVRKLAERADALEKQNYELVGRFIPERSRMGRDLQTLRMEAESVDNPLFWHQKAQLFKGEPLTLAEQTEINQLLAAKDKAGLVNKVAGYQQSSPSQQVFSWYQANLLTNPLTHVVNFSSNLAMTAAEQLTRAPAALADRLMSLRTGERTTAGLSFQELGALARGSGTGFREGARLVRGQTDRSLAEAARQVRYSSKPVETYVNGVFNILEAGDRPFYHGNLQASLVNEARAQAMSEGLRGRAVTARAKELLVAPSDELWEQATERAKQAVFKDETWAGKALKSLQNMGLPIKFIVPFSRTPGAIATRQFEYSDFGLLYGLAKVGRVLKQSPRLTTEARRALQLQAATTTGRGATGVALRKFGEFLYEQGLLTPVSDAAAERDMSYLSGEAESALQLGGVSLSLARLNPLGNTLVLGASIAAKRAGDGNPLWDRALEHYAAIARSTTAVVTDQPFLSGLEKLTRIRHDPAALLGAFQSVPGGMVPLAGMLGGVARSVDPYYRDVYSKESALGRVGDQLLSRLPGASMSLPAIPNQFGEPSRRGSLGQRVATSLVSPLAIRSHSTDPVVRALREADLTLSQRPRNLRHMAPYEGEELKSLVAETLQDPEFQALAPDLQQDALDTEVKKLRAAARRAKRAEDAEKAEGLLRRLNLP